MITNTYNLGDGGALHLQDVESLTSGIVDGRSFVFTAGRDDNGLSVFELNPDGTLTNLFNLDDTAALGIGSLNEIRFVDVGGQPILVTGSDEDAINLFWVNKDGSLELRDAVVDTDADLLNNVESFTTVSVDGVTYLVSGNQDSTDSQQGLEVFRLDSDGTLTKVSQVTDADDPAFNLDNIDAIVTAEAGGSSYVIAASHDDDGLSVFRVDTGGTLTNVFNIVDGVSPDLVGEELELDGVTALTTATMGGVTYVYAGGALDNGLSVLRLNDDGSLTNTANYQDGGIHNLGTITSLEAATTPGGTTYLFAVGDAIDGLQVYTVNDDGSLEFFDFVSDDSVMYLNNAEDITTAIIGGRLHVLAGGDENGVSVYSVPCFVSGTLIETPRGPRAVETLRPGDLVITADHGPQPIRFVAMRRLGPGRRLDVRPHLAPILIRAGAFGPGVPARDLRVSPQHRLLLSGWLPELHFGHEEALAPARSLVDGKMVCVCSQTTSVTYVHLGFDRHEIVVSEGMLTESFLPGPEAINGLDAPLRDELMTLFPQLRCEDLGQFAAARPILRACEAGVIRDHYLGRMAGQQAAAA